MSLMRPPQSGDPHDVSGVENAADLIGAMSTRPTHKLAGTREPLWIALTDLFQIPEPVGGVCSCGHYRPLIKSSSSGRLLVPWGLHGRSLRLLVCGVRGCKRFKYDCVSPSRFCRHPRADRCEMPGNR